MARAARRWKITPAQRELAGQLAQSLNVHPLVGQLMAGRGVTDPGSGRAFLDRRLTNLHDPELLPGAAQAADRIHQAALDGKTLCIYGDYDVDGMCSTAILLECLRLGGAKTRYYMPDRLEEGYGVNAAALAELRGNGVDMVITVDCGIASVEEALAARELGLEYIVTDHHEMAVAPPAADAVVHPRLEGSSYPFGDLCGAGVAFKLAWEIARRFSGQKRTSDLFKQFLIDATSLAAIGTICDMVPLVDENRVLVHHGLQSLKRQPCLGLSCLMETSKLNEKPTLSTGDVGFTLGPRLNACGRLGTARLGVELLTTRDRERAAELARYLESENDDRQTLERRIFKEARSMVEEVLEETDHPAIVLSSSNWHQGVIGIVASRMVERFHRPCILISENGEQGTGSGRSIAGFHLQRALVDCSHLLIKAGGHAMAAGLRIDRDGVDAFRERFCQLASEQLSAEQKVAELRIDAEVPLHVLTPSLLRSLEVIEPFGVGNATPLLMATDLTIVGEPKCVGGGERHLSFRVQQGGRTLKAIAFNQAERAGELVSDSGKCCLAFQPMLNHYRGFVSVDLKVADFHPGGQLAPDYAVSSMPTSSA